MTSESQPVFQVRQLGRTFDLGEVKIQALRGIGLEIYEGEFLVMQGLEAGERVVRHPGQHLRPDMRIRDR